jgi:hypothetical protein
MGSILPAEYLTASGEQFGDKVDGPQSLWWSKDLSIIHVPPCLKEGCDFKDRKLYE